VLALTLLGLAAGFAVAWEVVNSMPAVVSGIAPRDAVTFGISSALLVAVAIVSSFVPLKRIAKLDPVMLLATE